MRKTFLLALLTIVYNLTFGQVKERMLSNVNSVASNSDKALQLYNKGVEKFNQKNYQQAIKLYKLAIAQDSNYIDAYNNLGLSFSESNALDSAERYLTISTNKNPKGLVAFQNLAIVEQKKKNLSKAEVCYNKIVELDGKNSEGYYGLATILANEGKLSESLKNAQIAEKYYKEQNSAYIGDVYNLILIIYFNLHDKANGQKYFQLCKTKGIVVDVEIQNWLK